MKKINFAAIAGVVLVAVAVVGFSAVATAERTKCPGSRGGCPGGGGSGEAVLPAEVNSVDIAFAVPTPDPCNKPPEGDACTSGDDEKGKGKGGTCGVVSGSVASVSLASCSNEGGGTTANDASFSWPFASA